MPTRKRNSKPRRFSRRLIIGGDVTQKEIDDMITKVEDLTKEIIELKRRIREENGIESESENNPNQQTPLALTHPDTIEHLPGNDADSTDYEGEIETWTTTPGNEKQEDEPLHDFIPPPEENPEETTWKESLPPTPPLSDKTPLSKDTVFTQDIIDSLPEPARKYNTLNSLIKRVNEKKSQFVKKGYGENVTLAKGISERLKKITTKEELMEFLQEENGKNKRTLDILKGGAKTRKQKQNKQRKTRKN